jgi:hypothetical protein
MSDCDHIRTGFVVQKASRENNSLFTSGSTQQEKVLLQRNSWLGRHHPFLPNNLKKLASMSFKGSHRTSRKVRKDLYKGNLRNGRKTVQFCEGMCSVKTKI